MEIPIKNVDRYDDFFFRSRAMDLVSRNQLHMLDRAWYDKPVFETLGTSGKTSNRQQKKGSCRQQGQDNPNNSQGQR